MTYLGTVNMGRENKIIAEEQFPISEQGYTTVKLLDSTECQLLFDMGASKSFMSKLLYLHCKSLHSLPKFASKTQDPSRKWTICEHTFCDSNNSRHTWP